MRKFLPLLSLALLLAAAPAAAFVAEKAPAPKEEAAPAPAPANAAITPAGAEALKKQIVDSLQWRLETAKASGGGLTLDGDITVTPKGNYYEALLPGAAILIKGKGRFDIGTMTLKVTPADKGAWNVETTFPDKMTGYDMAKKPVMEFIIGSQFMTGTWLPEQDLYTKADMRLKDITVRSLAADDKLSGTIGSVAFKADMTEAEKNAWSGEMSYEITGSRFNMPDIAEIDVSLITSRTVYDKVNLGAATAMRKTLQTELKDGLPTDEAGKKAAFSKILATPPVMSGDVKARLEAHKINVRIPEQKATPQGGMSRPPQTVSLESLTFGGATTAIDKEKARIFARMGFNGLRSSLFTGALAGLIPESFQFETVFENVPVNALTSNLFTALRDGVEKTPADADTKAGLDASVKDAAGRIPKMMDDADASMLIRNTYLQSRDLRTEASGTFKANAAAKAGMTGSTAVSIRGLDEALQKLKAEAMKPDAAPDTMGAVVMLMALQAKGQSSTAADSASLRNYNFELTQDGRVLMNGTELINPMAPKPPKRMRAPIAPMPETKAPETKAPEAPATTPAP